MKKFTAALCVAALIFLCACGGVASPPELTSQMRIDLLGTLVTLSTYDSVDKRVFDEAFALVADIESRMSTNLSDSEIYALNSNSGGAALAVSPDTRALIELGADFAALSDGAFDITVGAVMELWKADEEFAVRPGDDAIADRIQLVNYRDISFSDDGVLLQQLGMRLDLGGIAKGYACDVVLDYFKQQGITSALLDFGGNIYAHGLKPNGDKWKLAIQMPLIGDNGVACTLEVANASVVTSGGYERYFETDGMVYHHILDPKTGYPAESGLLSVTIVDASSTRADALSTACFVLGLAEGYALLESLPGSEGVFITDNGDVYATSGLAGTLKVTDSRLQFVPGMPE